MFISKKNNTESIKITHFAPSEDGIELSDITLEVPRGTSEFAISAMLKGFNDHFLTVSGTALDEEMLAGIKSNLELFATKTLSKRSGIILP
jgi:hypothetical protein